MTTEERPQRTVLATVKSKAEVEDGWKFELDIPEFGGKFPTLCTRVKPEVAALVKPGQTLGLVLERQSLKKGKDGAYPSHYYWGLVGVAPPGSTPAPTPKGAMPPGGGRRDDSPETRVSIEAQTSFNGAVSLIAAKIRASQLKPDSLHVELVELTCWGMEAIQQAKRREAKHTGKAAPPTGPEASSPPASEAPAPVSLATLPPKTPTTIPSAGASPGAAFSIPQMPNWGALYQWAYRGYNKVRSEVETAFREHQVEMPLDPNHVAEILVGWWGPPKGGG